MIRLANKEDAEAIAAVYRPYVEHSHFTFEEVPPDAAEIAERMSNPMHPWLVAEEDGRVLGYASTSPMPIALLTDGASRRASIWPPKRRAAGPGAGCSRSTWNCWSGRGS